MKILGVSLLIFIVLAGFSVWSNFLIGLNFENSFKNTMNPFVVKDTPEFVLFLILLFFFFAGPIVTSVKQSKKGKEKNQQKS